MKQKMILLESGKSVAVFVLGLLYFVAVSYLTGFVAAHSSFPIWEHGVLTRHAYGEFIILALGYDFLRYFIPAFLAAYLASRFTPSRWLVYSLFLIGPYAGSMLAFSWLHPLPAGVGLLHAPGWKIIYWTASSLLLYGLPPAILLLIYKIKKHKAAG